LKGANTKSEGEIPATLDDLVSSGIRLVISDKNDPDGVGYIQWRCAFYCAGDEGSLANFMSLLDQFISFKAHQLAKDVEIHIHPHSSAEETASEDALSGELEYKHYTFHDAASKGLPLKWCQWQPVVSKKLVSMDIQPVSGDVVSFLWSGQTWGFRAALDSADCLSRLFCSAQNCRPCRHLDHPRLFAIVFIPYRRHCHIRLAALGFRLRLLPKLPKDIRGAYFEESTEGGESSTGRTYYRTCQVDLSGEKGKIQQVIAEVFHNLAMRVVVRHPPEEGSAVAALITELREVVCLHFGDDM
jgi:hypothetical protein